MRQIGLIGLGLAFSGALVACSSASSPADAGAGNDARDVADAKGGDTGGHSSDASHSDAGKGGHDAGAMGDAAKSDAHLDDAGVDHTSPEVDGGAHSDATPGHDAMMEAGPT